MRLFLAFLAAIVAACASHAQDTETLLDGRRKAYEKDVEVLNAEAKKQQDAWPDRYLEALASLERKFQKAGDLDSLIAVKKERDRFAGSKRQPEEPARSIPELAAMQEKAIRMLKEIELQRCRQILLLADKYASWLEEAKKGLTKQGRIEDALKVKDEIVRVRKRAEVTAAQFTLADAGVETAPAETGGSAAVREAGREGRGSLPRNLRDGLVLYFSFDRDEKGRITDISGNGISGEVRGAKWTPKGKVGGAYEFDGKDDYIELGPSNMFKSRGRLSACSWVNIRKLGATPFSNYHGGGAYQGQFFFSFYTIDGTERGGVLDVNLGQGSGVFLRYLSDKRPLPLNEWHHVAFSYDEERGAGRKIALYFDGKEVPAGLIQGEGNGGPVLDIGENLRIMAHRDTPTGTLFDGFVDEVMMFDRALSAEEVRQIYEAQK